MLTTEKGTAVGREGRNEVRITCAPIPVHRRNDILSMNLIRVKHRLPLKI